MAADDKIPRSIYEHSPNSRITISSVIFYVLVLVAMVLLISIRNMNTSSSELSFGLTCLKTPEAGETITSSTFEEGGANPQLPIEESTEESIDEENENGETNYTSSTSEEGGANPQFPIEENTKESIDEENEHGETNTASSTFEKGGANPQLPIEENTEESIDEEIEDRETNFISSTSEEGGVNPQLPIEENSEESIDEEIEDHETNTTPSTSEKGGANHQLPIEENTEESIDDEIEDGETNITSSSSKEGGANPQLSIEENKEESIDEENEDPLIPPPQVTKAERMAWFRSQLPKLEILKSSNYSSTLFHNRVLNFLTQNCSTFFHAIWLSPAKFFGEREFMTMDTLLKVHSQGCLMNLSRSMDSELGNMILKPLVDRGLKVEAVTPDLPFLVKDTPAEAWLEQLKSGNKDPGYIPLSQNLSNLMRLAMLYKYGGVYLDTDLIFIKDLSHLRNAIGAQAVDPVTKKWLRLNNAVLIFDKNHPLLGDFLEEFALTFDGSRLDYNGPYMVSRVIARVGNPPGYNLTILPPKAFYPVDWNKIREFYKKPENETGKPHQLGWKISLQIYYLEGRRMHFICGTRGPEI